MIIVIAGSPGTGKTYYATHWLLKNICYDNGFGFFNVRPGHKLYSNIDSLQIDHSNQFDISLDEMERNNNLKSSVTYVLDEAWSFGKDKLETVYLPALRMHRHYAVTMILIVQRVGDLPPSVRQLADYHLVAQPRMFDMSFAGTKFTFERFHPTDSEKKYGKISVKFSKNVAQYYKSSFTEELIQPGKHRRNAQLSGIGKLLLIPFFAFVAFLIYFFLSAPEPLKAQKIQPPVALAKKFEWVRVTPKITFMRYGVLHLLADGQTWSATLCFNETKKTWICPLPPDKNNVGALSAPSGDGKSANISGKSNNSPSSPLRRFFFD